MPDLKLPPVGKEVEAQARAYLNHVLGDQQEITEQMVHVVARFAELRQIQPGFLRDLAGQEVSTPERPGDKAWREFKSDVCPACGGKKPPAKYWVCRKCWDRLPRAISVDLIHGFRERDLPAYQRALSYLGQVGVGRG